ncbi:two-partner secretion domain-containing protein [Chroococcidiopsis sp.]|uniref:two-partner secretion domain-containing protein n=1 Tax=Chroococcidiopsis sp. TaxID=3088168 RepID=UPI003F3F51D6
MYLQMFPILRCWGVRLGLAGVVVGGAIAFGNTTLAQVVPDSQIRPDETLGAENSLVTSAGEINGTPSDRIDGGAIRGTNLFHSFQQFSIDEGRGAYFSNPTGVENILSRVTGTNTSNIFGKLGVLGNANLFLINPNGIIFGPNATLDVRGSFVGTTANAVRLGETGLFSASEPTTSNLLAVNPSALFFNALAAQRQIVNQSRGLGLNGETNVTGGAVGLQVPAGRTLALVGGNVLLNDGNLTAKGGRIEIGSVGNVGEVKLNQVEGGLLLDYSSINSFGEVRLENTAVVDVTAGDGGSIAVNAADIALDSSFLYAGILSDSGSAGAQAGDITLDATDKVTVANNSYIFNNLDSGALGNSGNVNVEAKRLRISDGAQVGVLNFGEGNTGNVNVRASEAVELSRGDTAAYGGLFAQLGETGKGTAGDILVETGSLTVGDGAAISTATFGEGNAGRIEIKARDTVSLFGQGRSYIESEIYSGGVGDSGGISIDTGSLFLSDKAVISSNVNGRGNSGGVDIVARDLVSLDDPGAIALAGEPGTLILSRVNDGAVGNGGNINIKTGSLRVSNSQITTSTSGEGDSGDITIEARDRVTLLRSTDLFTEVTSPSETESGMGGIGKGGDITIKTGSLLIDGGSNLRADTESRGDAGNITIEARDSITFSGRSDRFTSGAFTQVEPEAVGRGGDINITTGTLSLSGDQEINTRTQGQGDAGNIFIKADSISLAGSEVRIISGASQQNRLAGTSGNGGDINITAGSLIVTDGAQLSANTEIRGAAGNINIDASRLTLDNRSTIKSESVADIDGGNITLNIADLLLMRRNSGISTNAGTAQAGGNGGNITINTPFIVALPEENSDISADAYSGKGGNIRINAEAIFGIQQRSQQTPLSDITASSQLGVDGTVQLNSPEVDPSRDVVELPTTPVDASTLVASGCPSGAENRFVVAGRGGLPPAPGDKLSTDALLTDWATLQTPETSNRATEEKTNPEAANATTNPLVEATTWQFGSKGEIVLTNADSTTSGQFNATPTTCPSS